MLTYISRRVLYSVPVLVIASFLTFWAVRITFDPTAKLRTSRQAARIVAERRRELGLDRPIVVQWWRWLRDFVGGDLGISERTHSTVGGMITHAMGPTLQLIVWGTVLSALIAIGV